MLCLGVTAALAYTDGYGDGSIGPTRALGERQQAAAHPMWLALFLKIVKKSIRKSSDEPLSGGCVATERLSKDFHKCSVASAPSKARLCQSGAGPDPGSPGQAPGPACCVGDGNVYGEAYTGR